MAATLENPTQVAKEKSQADREKDQCENKLGKKAQEKRAQRTKKTRKILALMTLHCTDGTSNSGPFSPRFSTVFPALFFPSIMLEMELGNWACPTSRWHGLAQNNK